jgi:drug/metabolite transporter (DMT)-like permease
MKPRPAGVLGIVAALIITVYSGALIATPPFSILGALGLVGGGILFAIAASWTVRKSWAKSSLLEMRVHPLEKTNLLAFLILSGVYASTSIFKGSRDLVRGDSDGWIFVTLGLMLIALAVVMYMWTAKRRRKE